MRNVKNKYNVNTAGYVEQKESENKDGHSVVYYVVSED